MRGEWERGSLLEERPKRHVGTAYKLLDCFVVDHSVLHCWTLAGACFVHGDEDLGDEELKEGLCVLRETAQDEGDAFFAADAAGFAAEELVDFVDGVEFGTKGSEGGAVVEGEVEEGALARVPEEGEVGRVGGADEANLGVGGELGEDGLAAGFPEGEGVD
jgi:hypothetical protein